MLAAVPCSLEWTPCPERAAGWQGCRVQDIALEVWALDGRCRADGTRPVWVEAGSPLQTKRWSARSHQCLLWVRK